jgi:thiol:disulfide interchange protein
MLMYVEFSAEWCPACAVFKSRVLSDPVVKAALVQMVFVSVDVDKDAKLAEKFGVGGIPAGFLIRAQKNAFHVLNRHDGMLEKRDFLAFLALKGD